MGNSILTRKIGAKKSSVEVIGLIENSTVKYYDPEYFTVGSYSAYEGSTQTLNCIKEVSVHISALCYVPSWNQQVWVNGASVSSGNSNPNGSSVRALGDYTLQVGKQNFAIRWRNTGHAVYLVYKNN